MIRAGAIAMVLTACGATTSESEPPPTDLASATIEDRAPLTPFTPPSPLGCAGASAYDFCFAFDHGTPLEVHVKLARPVTQGANAVVRFARVVPGTPKRNLDRIAFTLPRGGDELVLYFQVDPGAFRIGFGDDDVAWSPIVEVGASPVATHFSLN